MQSGSELKRLSDVQAVKATKLVAQDRSAPRTCNIKM